jgi:hypothetical protein
VVDFRTFVGFSTSGFAEWSGGQGNKGGSVKRKPRGSPALASRHTHESEANAARVLLDNADNRWSESYSQSSGPPRCIGVKRGRPSHADEADSRPPHRWSQGFLEKRICQIVECRDLVAASLVFVGRPVPERADEHWGHRDLARYHIAIECGGCILTSLRATNQALGGGQVTKT